MDKLSSILPTSPRVRNVDMTDAQPVRPGITTYGRPVGVNVLKDRLTLSQQAKDMAFKETLGTINPRETNSVKIANEMSRNFFDQKIAEIKGKPASEETLEREAEIQNDLPEATDIKLPAKAAAPAPTGQRLDLEA